MMGEDELLKDFLDHLVSNGIHELVHTYEGVDWLIGIKKKPSGAGATQLAEDIIKYFNEVNGTRYQAKTIVRNITTILRSYPEASMLHFEAIILHKFDTWGKDDKMREFNRPATLFGSYPKFLKYLDDARQYFARINKVD
jgi:uncharacterized phage protein (TIGR02220 family)